jgi:hypothetical protein
MIFQNVTCVALTQLCEWTAVVLTTKDAMLTLTALSACLRETSPSRACRDVNSRETWLVSIQVELYAQTTR